MAKKTKEIKKIKGLVRIGVFSALWIAVSFAISCSIAFFAPVLLVQTLDKKCGAAHVAAKVEQTNRLQEYLTGMKVIKAYNLGGSNFTKLTRAFRNFMSESIKLEAVSGPFYLVAISFLQAGVWLLSGGKVDISVFVMFLFMGNRIFEPLAGAITQLPVFVYKKAAGERIVDLMDEPFMAGDGDALAQHEIVFDHVSFGYGEKEILHDVSAEFCPGTMTAIVAPSGSGKAGSLP